MALGEGRIGLDYEMNEARTMVIQKVVVWVSWATVDIEPMWFMKAVG